MGRLSDQQLRSWVSKGEAIAGKSDGDGLTFTLSKKGVATWVFRYRHADKQREYTMGRYPGLSLSDARAEIIQLRRRVELGENVAATKQAEKAREKLDATNIKALALEWLERAVGESQRYKIRRVLEKYAFPVIGNLEPEDVHPSHIDRILRGTVEAGAPTVANDVLRYLKRLFAFARKRRIVKDNPAADFDNSDAGGKEVARDRSLSLDEIKKFLKAMKDTPTLGRDNELAFSLLLLLGVRKSELLKASWEEFDLESGLWNLPEGRTKTSESITIPLPPLAVSWLEELHVRAAGSIWVFPARRVGSRKLGHISPDTLNLALTRVEHGLDHFTVHDLRRTVRTQLAALGIPPHIAEKVLNHKLKGIEAVYDQYDYLEERKHALEQWAAVLGSLEKGGEIIPIKKAK